MIMLMIFFISNTYNYAQTKKILSFGDQIKDQRLKLRNDAFCQCMWKVDSSILNLNDGSAAGYKAYMAYGDELILDLKIFTSEWVNKNEKNYTSWDNSLLTTMKCLDFYNSEELKKFALKQDKRIDRDILKQIYKK